MSNRATNPSSARPSRSTLRMENNIKAHGSRMEISVKHALFEKLLHGYKSITEVMSGMHITTSFRAIHLPISTRAIGFTTRALIKKFSGIGINNVVFPVAFLSYGQ